MGLGGETPHSVHGVRPRNDVESECARAVSGELAGKMATTGCYFLINGLDTRKYSLLEYINR